MRERITFVHKPGSAVDKDALKVTASTLEGPDLPDAAREDRLTFGLDELPRDARAFLEGSVTELHVRWVSPQPYEALPPFLLARLSPGLHVFFTPRRGAEKKGRSVNAGTEICSWLRRLFGNLRCVSLEVCSVNAEGWRAMRRPWAWGQHPRWTRHRAEDER